MSLRWFIFILDWLYIILYLNRSLPSTPKPVTTLKLGCFARLTWLVLTTFLTVSVGLIWRLLIDMNNTNLELEDDNRIFSNLFPCEVVQIIEAQGTPYLKFSVIFQQLSRGKIIWRNIFIIYHLFFDSKLFSVTNLHHFGYYFASFWRNIHLTK